MGKGKSVTHALLIVDSCFHQFCYLCASFFQSCDDVYVSSEVKYLEWIIEC